MTSTDLPATAAELRSLRKGRGAQAPDLVDRLGPRLHELAAAGGDRVATRPALVAELTSRAANLPDDLRWALLASLGLTVDTRQMTRFEDRVSWLAARLEVASRTALRRIDEAERLLGEHIDQELHRRRGRKGPHQHGWDLDELRTVLRLDTERPEAHEHRRIVATRDGLREIMAWLDVPATGPDARPAIDAEVVYGGRLVRREQPSRQRFHFVIQLPAPLRVGDIHEYGLLVRMAGNEPMRPHYIFTPECRCARFRLRVRFHLDHLPRWVRRVEAETVRMFDAAQPVPDELIEVNGAGEVDLAFDDLACYLGYGAQWGP